MGGLAEGIEKSRGLVTKEIEKLTDTMNLENMMPDMDASLNATVGGKTSSGENGTVKLNQPIMLDGRVIRKSKQRGAFPWKKPLNATGQSLYCPPS